jgi:hypothetical protein
MRDALDRARRGDFSVSDETQAQIETLFETTTWGS